MRDADEKFLKRDERLVLTLRALYERYGYRKYKMRRFEEYDLYLNNKDFLKTRHIITFHDLDGRVLALKPDVTLSIVKSTRASGASTEKIYYLENVYRLDPLGAYREISQLGLECFGRLPEAGMVEVLMLAGETLGAIDPDFRLTISDTRFVQELMDALPIDESERARLLECIQKKRAHEARELLEARGVSEAEARRAAAVAELGGAFPEAADAARALCRTAGMARALDGLSGLYEKLSRLGFAERVRLDFSTINDLNYYSGVVFQGYVPGIPRPVMAGGYYGALLKKFGKDLDAIGFAVYLNELEQVPERREGPDVDELILYDDGADAAALYALVRVRTELPLSVRVERSIPAGLRYGRLLKFDGECLAEVGTRA